MKEFPAFSVSGINRRPVTEFSLGDRVYLKVREEKIPGMVTGYIVRPTGITYQITWSNTGAESGHYAIELTTEYEMGAM